MIERDLDIKINPSETKKVNAVLKRLKHIEKTLNVSFYEICFINNEINVDEIISLPLNKSDR